MKIIIIEDEYNLADAIATMLKKEKYYVDIFTDGKEGFDNASLGIYDLLILDVMVPNMDGFQILKKLREDKINIKILMLTARNGIDSKMQGFNNGANDYLTKPFHMEELLARVNLQLRNQTTNQNSNILNVGDIQLNIRKLELTCINTGESINIVGKEFQILELFMINPNIVLTKEDIFIKVWGYDSDCELNNLEAYISFIRKKLKIIGSNIIIKVLRGIGYKLEVNDEKTKN